MEIVGQGLIALSDAVGAWAIAYALIYIVGIGTKTFLIYNGKVKIEELKSWFDFGFGKKGDKL